MIAPGVRAGRDRETRGWRRFRGRLVAWACSWGSQDGRTRRPAPTRSGNSALPFAAKAVP
jgi:hypothetical protein